MFPLVSVWCCVPLLHQKLCLMSFFVKVTSFVVRVLSQPEKLSGHLCCWKGIMQQQRGLVLLRGGIVRGTDAIYGHASLAEAPAWTEEPGKRLCAVERNGGLNYDSLRSRATCRCFRGHPFNTKLIPQTIQCFLKQN